jgi:hypothetical protein
VLSIVLSLFRCHRGHEPILHKVSGKYNSGFYLGMHGARPPGNASQIVLNTSTIYANYLWLQLTPGDSNKDFIRIYTGRKDKKRPHKGAFL